MSEMLYKGYVGPLGLNVWYLGYTSLSRRGYVWDVCRFIEAHAAELRVSGGVWIGLGFDPQVGMDDDALEELVGTCLRSHVPCTVMLRNLSGVSDYACFLDDCTSLVRFLLYLRAGTPMSSSDSSRIRVLQEKGFKVCIDYAIPLVGCSDDVVASELPACLNVAPVWFDAYNWLTSGGGVPLDAFFTRVAEGLDDTEGELYVSTSVPCEFWGSHGMLHVYPVGPEDADSLCL